MTDEPDPSGADPLFAEADGLYALPAAQFTAARDARAKELKPDAAQLAGRVKALRRPTVAAWAVNLLVRREAGQVTQVLEVGAALREAAAALDGPELRELTRQRRQLTAAVAGRVRALAAAEGVRLTESVREQVEATLTAAMLDQGAAAAVRSGLLVSALTATGVDPAEVATAVAVPEALGFTATEVEAGRPELRSVPAGEDVGDTEAEARLEAERARAAEALAEAEAALTRSQERADGAQQRLGEVTARRLEVASELEELARRVADAEARLEQVDADLGDAEIARDRARDEFDDARRNHDHAAEQVESLWRSTP